jgi:hypothetical protein
VVFGRWLSLMVPWLIMPTLLVRVLWDVYHINLTEFYSEPSVRVQGGFGIYSPLASRVSRMLNPLVFLLFVGILNVTNSREFFMSNENIVIFFNDLSIF